MSRTGPVSYQVETTPGVFWRRHIEQLRDASSTISAPISLLKAGFVLPSGDLSSSVLPGGEDEKECDATPEAANHCNMCGTGRFSVFVTERKLLPSRISKAPQKLDL